VNRFLALKSSKITNPRRLLAAKSSTRHSFLALLITAFLAAIIGLTVFALTSPTHPLNPLNLIARPAQIAKISELDKSSCSGCSGNQELFWSTKDGICKARDSKECKTAAGPKEKGTKDRDREECTGCDGKFGRYWNEKEGVCKIAYSKTCEAKIQYLKHTSEEDLEEDARNAAAVSTGNYCNINGQLYPPNSVIVGSYLDGKPSYLECVAGKWQSTDKTQTTPAPGTPEYDTWVDEQIAASSPQSPSDNKTITRYIDNCRRGIRETHEATGEGRTDESYLAAKCGSYTADGEITLTEEAQNYIDSAALASWMYANPEEAAKIRAEANEDRRTRQIAACTGCVGRNHRIWNYSTNTCELKEFTTCIEEEQAKEQRRLQAVALSNELIRTGTINTNSGLGAGIQSELTALQTNIDFLKQTCSAKTSGPVLEDCNSSSNTALRNTTVEEYALQKIYELSPEIYQQTINSLRTQAEAAAIQEQNQTQQKIDKLVDEGIENLGADAQRLTALARSLGALEGTSGEALIANRELDKFFNITSDPSTRTINYGLLAAKDALSSCQTLCDKRYGINGTCVAALGGNFQCVNLNEFTTQNGVTTPSTTSSVNIASLKPASTVGGGHGSASISACGGLLDRCCNPGNTVGSDTGVTSACNTGLRCNAELNVCTYSTAHQQAQAVKNYLSSQPELEPEEIIQVVASNTSFSLKGENPLEVQANLQSLTSGLCGASCTDSCVYSMNAKKFTCVSPTKPTNDAHAMRLQEQAEALYDPSLPGGEAREGEYGNACRTMWFGLFPKCNNDLLTCNRTTNRCEYTPETQLVLANQAVNGSDQTAAAINLSLFASPVVSDIADSALLAKSSCTESGKTFVSGSSCWLCRSELGSKSLQKLGPAALCEQGNTIASLVPGQQCRASGGWCGKGISGRGVMSKGPSDCAIGETCFGPDPGAELNANLPGESCTNRITAHNYGTLKWFSDSWDQGTCATGLTCFEGTCQEQQTLAFNEMYSNDATAEKLENWRVIGPILSAFKRSGFTWFIPTTYEDAIEARAATTLAMINNISNSPLASPSGSGNIGSYLFESLDEAGQARTFALKLALDKDLNWLEQQFNLGIRGVRAWEFLSAYTGEPPISRGGAAGTNAFFEYARRNAELNAEIYAENPDANYAELLGNFDERLASAGRPAMQAAFFAADVGTGIGAGLARSGVRRIALSSGKLFLQEGLQEGAERIVRTSLIDIARESGLREAAQTAFYRTLYDVGDPAFVFNTLIPDFKIGSTTLRSAFKAADQWTVDALGTVIGAPFRAASEGFSAIRNAALRRGFGSEEAILDLALRTARAAASEVPDATVQRDVFHTYIDYLLEQTKVTYRQFAGKEPSATQLDQLRGALEINLIQPKPVSSLAFSDFSRLRILRTADLSTEAGRNDLIRKLAAKATGIAQEDALAQAKTLVSVLEFANKYGLKDGGEINKLMNGFNAILLDVANKERPLTLSEALSHLTGVSEKTRNVFAQALQAENFTTLVESGVPGLGPVSQTLVSTRGALEAQNSAILNSFSENKLARFFPPDSESSIASDLLRNNPEANVADIARAVNHYRENLLEFRLTGVMSDPDALQTARSLLTQLGLSESNANKLLNFQFELENLRALLNEKLYSEDELLELITGSNLFANTEGSSALGQIVTTPIGVISSPAKYSPTDAEYILSILRSEGHANLVVPKENALVGALRLRAGDTITVGGRRLTLERGMYIQVGDAKPVRIGLFGTSVDIPAASHIRIGSALDEAGNIVSPRNIRSPLKARFTSNPPTPILERLGLRDADGAWFFQSSPERRLARSLEKLNFASISPDDPLILSLTKLLPESNRAETAAKLLAYAQNIKTSNNHLDPRALLVEVKDKTLSLQELAESRALRAGESISATAPSNRFAFLFEQDGKTYGVYRDETGLFHKVEVNKSGNSWLALPNTASSNTALTSLLPSPEKITSLTLPSNYLAQGAHLTNPISVDVLSGKNINFHLDQITKLTSNLSGDPDALRAALAPYGFTDSELDGIVGKHATTPSAPTPPAGAAVDTPPAGAVADTPQTAPDDVVARTEADKIVQEEAPPVDLEEPSVDINELVVEEVIDNAPAPSLSQVWAGSRANPKNWDLLEKLPFFGKETQRTNQAIRAAIETQTQKLTQKSEGLLMQGYSEREVRALIKQDLDRFIAHNNIEIGITQRGIISENIDKIVTDSTVTYRATVQNPSRAEARRIVNESIISGSPGVEKVPRLTPEYLASQGLEPVESITIGDTTIHVSRTYSDGNRLFAVGYVEIDGKIHTRSFYKSNSQGVWRVASHRGAKGWYGKGIGEELMSLPTPVQQRLNILDKNPLNFSDENIADNVFFGGLEYRPGRSSQFADLPNDFKQGLDNRRLGSVGHFTDPDNPTTWIWTDPNYAPDFSKITSTYNHAACPNQICKDVDAFVVRSRDNKIEYLFFRDKQTGKVWIASSEIVDSRLNSYGIHRTAVNLDRLAMPIWEYREHIPQNYVGRKLSDGSPYSDASAFVDQLEIIQDAKRAISAFDLTSKTPDTVNIQRFIDDLVPTQDGLSLTPVGPSLGDWFASSPVNPKNWSLPEVKLPTLKLPEIKLPTLPWNQTDADRLVRQLAREGKTITPERAAQLLDALPNSLDASERLVIAGALARSSDTQGVVTRHVNELSALLGDVKANRKNADAISTYFQEKLGISQDDAIHLTNKLTGSPEEVFNPQALTAPVDSAVIDSAVQEPYLANLRRSLGLLSDTNKPKWPWTPSSQQEAVSRAFTNAQRPITSSDATKLAEIFPHATQNDLTRLARALESEAIITSDGKLIPEIVIHPTKTGVETLENVIESRTRSIGDITPNHQYGLIYKTQNNQFVALYKAAESGKYYAKNVAYEAGNWKIFGNAIQAEVDNLTDVLPIVRETQGFILPDANGRFSPDKLLTTNTYLSNLPTVRQEAFSTLLASDQVDLDQLRILFATGGLDTESINSTPRLTFWERLKLWINPK